MTAHEKTFGQRRDFADQQGTQQESTGGFRDTGAQPPSGEDRELTERAREKAGHVGEKVDQQRERASHGLEAAVSQVREHAEQIPGGERTTDIANQAADSVQGVASYIQDHDVSAMMTDVERIVRDHPKESLIAAAAVGFLVARAVRS